MKVLITGITGFAGSHLADHILAHHREVEVWGIKRWRSRTENIDHLGESVGIVECDMRDYISVKRAVEAIAPDRIFHLAAQSFVPSSWHQPSESLTTNILSQLNLFEAVRELGLDPRIQIACSSEEYGLVHEDEIPIRETNPLRPLSPYAVSKVGQDYLGYQYQQSYGLKVVRTRGFNHTGPRRGDVFVCSDFARQVARIEAGLQEPVIRVGNLEAIRDFTHVRDMVRGYWMALDGGCTPGEVYNLCSGEGHTIQSVLDALVARSNREIEVQVDPARLRPSDVPILVGDATKFREATGWQPEIPFSRTLEELLAFWRERC